MKKESHHKQWSKIFLSNIHCQKTSFLGFCFHIKASPLGPSWLSLTQLLWPSKRGVSAMAKRGGVTRCQPQRRHTSRRNTWTYLPRKKLEFPQMFLQVQCFWDIPLTTGMTHLKSAQHWTQVWMTYLQLPLCSPHKARLHLGSALPWHSDDINPLHTVPSLPPTQPMAVDWHTHGSYLAILCGYLTHIIHRDRQCSAISQWKLFSPPTCRSST
jgi:hypothetical protein